MAQKPQHADIDEGRWLADRKKHYEKLAIEKENARRIVPFGNALERLVKAEAQNLLSPELKAFVIRLAADYARRTKQDFDGTLRGAIRLAGEADKTVRLAFEATTIRA
jgi:hypothetical protein